LSAELSDGFMPGLVAALSGLLVMLFVVVRSRKRRAAMRRLWSDLRSRAVPVWIAVGGVSGGALLLGQGLSTPVVGVVLFTVCLVTGQILGGVVFDWLGIGPAGRIKPSIARLAGGVLLIAAILISSIGEVPVKSSAVLLLPVVVGVMLAWQAGANGRLRAATESTAVTTFMSFLAGFVFLIPILVASIALSGFPQEWPRQPVLYIGGMFGLVYVGLNALFVRHIGILMLGMATVAGQLVASILLEYAWPLTVGVTLPMMIGAVVGLCALAVSIVPARGRRVY